jgi:hypothetical protein
MSKENVGRACPYQEWSRSSSRVLFVKAAAARYERRGGSSRVPEVIGFIKLNATG